MATRKAPGKAGAKKGKSEALEDVGKLLREAQTSRLANSELAESLGFLMRMANATTQAHIGQRFENLGLRQSLFSVLLIIHENPGLKQQEVGKALGIQQPNLVALINDLVDGGLVSRTVNKDDRRSYSLALTKPGEKKLAAAMKEHKTNEREIEEAIKPITVAQFRDALLRILDTPAP